MLTALVAVFLLAFIAPFILRKSPQGSLFVAACTAAAFGYFATFIKPVASGETLSFSYSWSPSLSVNFSFLIDGLSLFFALLILFLGILVILYSAYYFREDKYRGRFFLYLIFFMGAMLGVVLSANLITIYLFWELTSFSSYLLIGFHNREEKSRNAARQALLVTVLGGLAMLAGFILLGIAGGSYNISELLSDRELFIDHPYIQPIVILLLLGAFTKSAQFPFHFWLPNAMEAPTPVSAYLHSATMVKAGVYLIFRFQPVFNNVELWHFLLLTFGGITMLIGAVEAFRSDDLKRILAYTTISALGIFVMMAGIGTEKALKGAIVYLLAHALYKGGLFLSAGVLDHECGTRKISQLSGIRKKMPYTASAVILTSLSMAGILPFLGFIGKEMLYETAHSAPLYHQWLLAALVFSSVFFVGVAIKIVYRVFFSKSLHSGEPVREGSPWMVTPPLLLGFLGLLFGIIPSWSVKPLLQAAAGNMLINAGPLDMKLWHGFNLVFIFSIITVLLGVGLYFIGDRMIRMLRKIKFPIEKLPEKSYEGMLRTLQQYAELQTKNIQTGYLRQYISIYVVLFISLTCLYFFLYGMPATGLFNFRWEELVAKEFVIFVLVLVTLIFIFQSRSALVVVAAIGIVGYSIALSYTGFSAPDVAITQFLAETLGLILLILIVPKLPGFFRQHFKTPGKYLVVSVAFGLLMTLITMIGMTQESASSLKEFFLMNSIPKGKGENVVNVILVDFRALDTLGEISVLTITMIGIVSLLKYKNKKQDRL